MELICGLHYTLYEQACKNFETVYLKSRRQKISMKFALKKLEQDGRSIARLLDIYFHSIRKLKIRRKKTVIIKKIEKNKKIEKKSNLKKI